MFTMLIFCIKLLTRFFLMKDVHGQTYIAKVHQEIVGDYFPDEYSLLSKDDSEKEEESETSKLFEEDSVPYLRYFVHQHVKYLWSKRYQRFQMLTGIEQGIQLCDFHTFEGQSVQVQEAKYEYYLQFSMQIITLISLITDYNYTASIRCLSTSSPTGVCL